MFSVGAWDRFCFDSSFWLLSSRERDSTGSSIAHLLSRHYNHVEGRPKRLSAIGPQVITKATGLGGFWPNAEQVSDEKPSTHFIIRTVVIFEI